jgi:membrane protein YdbS with pleckstrin-like domain
MNEDLRTVKMEEFQRVWEVMKETYKTERHFNELETQYRILASQWLLGAFAGIGFVIVSDPKLSFDKLWLVVAICLISIVGIYQLWRMDIVIYHKLLHATFEVGLELEAEYQFLPKIKTRMKNSVPGKSASNVLFYYYYISIVFFSAVGLGVSVYLLTAKNLYWKPAIITVIVTGLLLLLHRYMRFKSKEKNINK